MLHLPLKNIKFDFLWNTHYHTSFSSTHPTIICSGCLNLLPWVIRQLHPNFFFDTIYLFLSFTVLALVCKYHLCRYIHIKYLHSWYEETIEKLFPLQRTCKYILVQKGNKKSHNSLSLSLSYTNVIIMKNAM